MSSQTFVAVDTLHSGQVRAYSGCRYTARITFTRSAIFTNEAPDGVFPFKAPEAKAIEVFRLFVDKNAIKKDDPTHAWHSTTFTEITNESDGVWLLDAYQEYLD